MSTRRNVHVLVSGVVQGVGYRAWTVAKARELGLDGWVRNRVDGRVEALFAGPAEAVARMVDACRRGPRLARVDAVRSTDTAEPIEAGFRCLPTV